MGTRSSELETRREEMFRWRGRFLALALPAWFALTWLGLKVSPTFALAGQLVLLGSSALVWRAVYRYAREAGGARYALGQLLLSVLLTPFLFAGIWGVPLLLDSDVERGIARSRADSGSPAWFVALDTLFVLALLVLVAALITTLGIVGLFVALLVMPVLYKSFRVATRPARS